MKKYLLLCGVLVISLVMAGCSSQQRISSLELKVDDGQVEPAYFSVTDLKITPDYDKRELKVVYSKAFPQVKGDVPVASEGTVGGDYFDRFELLEDDIYSGAMDSYAGGELKDATKGTFAVMVAGKDGQNKSYQVGWDESEEMIEDFRSFYLDLVNLLTESVPV